MQIIIESMIKIIYDFIDAQYYTHIQQNIKLNEFDEEKKKKQKNKLGFQNIEDFRYESEKMNYFFISHFSDFSTSRNIFTFSSSFRVLFHFRAGFASNQAVDSISQSFHHSSAF